MTINPTLFRELPSLNYWFHSIVSQVVLQHIYKRSNPSSLLGTSYLVVFRRIVYEDFNFTHFKPIRITIFGFIFVQTSWPTATPVRQKANWLRPLFIPDSNHRIFYMGGQFVYLSAIFSPVLSTRVPFGKAQNLNIVPAEFCFEKLIATAISDVYQ